jgi:REP element-mobilizing transposase RayT
MIWRSTIEQRDAGRIQLFAACLMPDHLHLLVGPANDDLIAFENAWKSWTTRQSWKLGNKNALWQPGMWDRTIRPDEDFEDVAMYIVAQPRRGWIRRR